MSAAMVVVCALQMLGRPAASLPPIELVTHPVPGLAGNVEAFVKAGSGVISIQTTSAVFAAATHATCASRAVTKIASIIAHEEWHVRNGADERGAYETQLAILTSSGISPTSSLYQRVLQSMHAVLASAQPAGRPVR